MKRTGLSSLKKITAIATAVAVLSVSVSVPVRAEEETVISIEDSEQVDAEIAELSSPELLEAAGFSELDDDYELSQEQLVSKQILSEHANEAYDGIEGVDYAANEIVVEASGQDEAEAYAKAFNAELVNYEYGNALLRIDDNGRNEEALREIARDDTTGIETDVAEADMVSLAVAVSADPDVNLPAAWPNYYDELLDADYDYSEFDDFAYEYDDPYLARESESGYQWHHEVVGSNAAWRAGYKGQGVNVVIIDSGVNAHEDINIIDSCRILDSGDIDNVTTDSSNHGTSVAGLIGAVAGNDTGGAGVAPECNMYMIRVTDNARKVSRYAETVAIGRAGEVYDADVINISIGGPNYTQYLETSIDYAYKKGIAVVCAAGNDGISADLYPASHPGAISVAASGISGERSVISNYGLAVRYGAPGDDVYAPSGRSSSSYSYVDGTSFAAPIITGMIADIISSGKVTGEGASYVNNILKMLDRSCTNATAGMGKGIPELATALGLDTNSVTPSCPMPDTPQGAYETEELIVGLTTGNSGSTHEDIIFYSTDGRTVSYTGGIPSNNAIRYDPDEKIVIGGKRTTVIKAIAVNPSNGLVSKQVTYTYTLKPLVSDIDFATATGSYKLRAGTNVALVATPLPSYAANRAVTYSVTGYPEDNAKTSLYVSSGRLYARANAVPGDYEITCTAKDAGHVSVSFDVTVESPDRKVSSIAVAKTSLVMYSGFDEDIGVVLKTTEGKVTIQDDADEYSIWSSSNVSVATADIEGNTLTVTAHKAGTATITGYSNDGTNKSCKIKITVRQHPESVSINPIAGNKVGLGKSIKLTAGVLPADTYNKGIKWSIIDAPYGSTSKTSATINASNGTFSTTAKTVCGTYTVKATCKDTDNNGAEVSDEYSVEVYEELTRKITLGSSSVNIFRKKNAYGCDTEALIPVTLTGGTFDTLSTTNNKPGIVDASMSEDTDGKIYLKVRSTANGTGTARVTVKANDGTGKSASVNVTVSNPPSYLEIGRPSGMGSNLAKGKSVKLTVKFGTLYGKLTSASQKLVWSSSNPDVVSVNSSGTITAKSNDGISATITARTFGDNDSKVVSSINITSVAPTTSITTDGLWKRWRTPTDSYFGEYIDYIESGKVGFLTLENNTNVAGGEASSMDNRHVDISVNKAGMPIKWSSATREEDNMPPATIALYGNVKGTYYVTVKMRDKSSATKRIKIVVK